MYNYRDFKIPYDIGIEIDREVDAEIEKKQHTEIGGLSKISELLRVWKWLGFNFILEYISGSILLFVVGFPLFVGFNPITVSAEDSMTVSIDVDSDYENVVVENENYTNVVHDKIVLSFSDVGEYKYKIYVPEDLNTSYTLTVVVGRNDSNQLLRMLK